MALFLAVVVALGLLFDWLWSDYFHSEGAGHAISPGLIGEAVGVIVLLPMMAGTWFVGVGIARSLRPNPLSILGWYSHTFKLVLLAILMQLMIALGLLCFILPGVYLFVGYRLALPLALDRDLGPWEAMETSRRIVHRCWFKVFTLDLLISLTMWSCLGLAIWVNPLAAIPLVWLIPALLVGYGILYDRLAGTREETIRRTMYHSMRRGLPRQHR